jgi:histidine triad (HIT) family protein
VSCIFCRIIAKEIPSEVVSEAPEWVAIRDINPKAPHHVLVIPRKHLHGIDSATPSDSALLGSLLLGAAEIARSLGEEAQGYRVVVNTGANGGQTVDHLHLHLLAGRGLAWPPG